MRPYDSDQSTLQESAAAALGNLAGDIVNAEAIASGGGVHFLAAMLRGADPAGRDSAGGALFRLAAAADAAPLAALNALAEGPIPILVGLLQLGTPAAVERAARAIRRLALTPGNRYVLARARSLF